MISKAHAAYFARYNRWQNQSHYREAGKLTDAQRRLDRGAHFKSIDGTLNHILWADSMWMHRLAKWPAPGARKMEETPFFHANFADLRAAREDHDKRLIAWTDGLEQAALEGDLTWTSSDGTVTATRPRWLLVTHMFNHETHHRGQVHAMLTAAGCKPDATDLPWMPE